MVILLPPAPWSMGFQVYTSEPGSASLALPCSHWLLAASLKWVTWLPSESGPLHRSLYGVVSPTHHTQHTTHTPPGWLPHIVSCQLTGKARPELSPLYSFPSVTWPLLFSFFFLNHSTYYSFHCHPVSVVTLSAHQPHPVVFTYVSVVYPEFGIL